MFWVDEVVAVAEKTYPGRKSFIVRDEKTPSGRVHVGSLRGVVIHGVIAQALIEKGYSVKYFYEINDADPMDGMPVYLPKEKFLPYMGKPLKDVPSPLSPDVPPTPQKNYAQYFGDDFIAVIRRLGFEPEFYLSSTLYAEGKYDPWIDIVLEKSEDIRRIYREVSGSEKKEEWNPVQVVCEKCGKVGTTTVIGSSGPRGEKTVEYICELDKVKWANGCGHKGKVAPYRGRGKLPWKVEWAAKWQIFPVDIEGAGKDHSVAGGSRDVSARIAREVFKGIVPVNVPYEFFTIGGAKMSSSKARGASAAEVVDMLPEELLRFLMVRNSPERHIDFEPSGSTTPRLFDFFDESVEIAYGRKPSDVADEIKKALHFSVIKPEHEKDYFRPRFSRTAFLIQMPQLDFLDEVAKLKGAKLTVEEKAEAERRSKYARIWLSEYATESDKFSVQREMPELAKTLSGEQKKFLIVVAGLLSGAKQHGEELHAAIHELRKKSPLSPKEGFEAIYTALLGKTSGPQAGWFLDALDQAFVIERFQECAALPAFQKVEIQNLITPLIVVHKEVRQRFPGIKLGFNILMGTKITRNHSGLSELRNKLLSGLDFEKIKKTSPRLEAFCEIYRNFGVNPTKNKPSPLALVSRLANGKMLPSINVAVDIYNTLVVKHQLSIGLFDLDKIKLPVELRFAHGGEKFYALGTDRAVPLIKGELCYFDSEGKVMARDFNYIDSELTKVDKQTTNIFLNVDGNHAVSLADVKNCLSELEELLVKYCGGDLGEQVLVDITS
ncbi:lysine--tRNA ligase [Candidatus Peregrinibacteria bacterium]|nr:lysine--tRNA ligase [Candidatus Peregrinibacteria bacterium]